MMAKLYNLFYVFGALAKCGNFSRVSVESASWPRHPKLTYKASLGKAIVLGKTL
jgi:hypothetical protein